MHSSQLVEYNIHVHQGWVNVGIFQIMDELASNGVEIYRFPVDDETVAEMNSKMNVSMF